MTVYIKPWCPWCVQAIDWLKSRHYRFDAVDCAGLFLELSGEAPERPQ